MINSRLKRIFLNINEIVNSLGKIFLYKVHIVCSKCDVHQRPKRIHSDVCESLDSFVDRCLRQVIPDLLQCTYFSSEMVFGSLGEVCKMPEACTPHLVIKWVEVWWIWWPLVLCDEVGTLYPQPVLMNCKNSPDGRAKHITLSKLEVSEQNFVVHRKYERVICV